MSTPFPGMDPYLERRGTWEDIHTPLVLEIANALESVIRPLHRIDIERRVYVTMLFEPEPLDVPPAPAGATEGAMLRQCELPQPTQVVEHFLQIRDVITMSVVTTIEVLSLDNKVTPEGRREYERQRLNVLGSSTNLVEIDLLRAGAPLPMRLPSDARSDYRIVVSRAHLRPRADVYLFGIQDAIPDVSIPQQRGTEEPLLKLNEILHQLYDRAGSDLVVDYRQMLQPPLADEDTHWVAQLLQPLKS